MRTIRSFVVLYKMVFRFELSGPPLTASLPSHVVACTSPTRHNSFEKWHIIHSYTIIKQRLINVPCCLSCISCHILKKYKISFVEMSDNRVISCPPLTIHMFAGWKDEILRFVDMKHHPNWIISTFNRFRSNWTYIKSIKLHNFIESKASAKPRLNVDFA